MDVRSFVLPRTPAPALPPRTYAAPTHVHAYELSDIESQGSPPPAYTAPHDYAMPTHAYAAPHALRLPGQVQRAKAHAARNWKRYAIAGVALGVIALIAGVAAAHHHSAQSNGVGSDGDSGSNYGGGGSSGGGSNGGGGVNGNSGDQTPGDSSPLSNGTSFAINGTTPWLYTRGNTIYQAPTTWNGTGAPPEGIIWRGRGANIQDTRSCDVCESGVSVAEVKRRIDTLCGYNVNFIRLTLESDNAGQSLLQDSDYFNDVQDIVNHIGTAHPGVYVQVSMWIDPTLTALGWPTNGTDTELAKLAGVFKDAPHVLFGVSNEPQYNYDGSNDTLVWNAMNNAVTAIRAQETAQLGGAHLVSVQGTRSWAQDITYYVDNPITAGNGANVLYELHMYDSVDVFQTQIVEPAQTLPVVIGEFGPSANIGVGTMVASDATALMQLARANNIPHAAWNYHMNCGPNLLVNDITADNACAEGAPLQLNQAWGMTWKNGMAQPWG